ncbi:MAG: DUF2938 domain-containing protein [Pseudomonadota bacterium]
MRDLTNIVLIGIGATAFTDLWAIARRRLLGVPLPNYGYIGRWIAHLAHGRLRHDSIAAAAPVNGERAIGWSVHYMIGVGFASILPAACGATWIHEPTAVPALLIGTVTVAAPFLVMQPAMGAGFAASRTLHPGAARLQSLATHVVFGLGLYLAALLVSKLSTGE